MTLNLCDDFNLNENKKNCEEKDRIEVCRTKQ